MTVPWKHALRDLALVSLTLGLWASGAAGAAWPVAVLAGALTAVCGYLVHEWGHLAGAWLGGSVVHLPATPLSTFLFNYDSDRNGREQFLVMSCGGFLASAVMVALFLALLPLDALAGRVALGLTLLGVVATVVLELPPAWRVYQGGPIPRGLSYHSSRSEP